MNSKPMLFECLDCKETYLADSLCDGYKCPKCNGHIASRGFIKEIEEHIRDMQEEIRAWEDKVDKAKENGLIRKYTKSIMGSLAHVPYDGYIAELPFNRCMCRVDYAKGNDFTVTVKLDTEQFQKDVSRIREEARGNIINAIKRSTTTTTIRTQGMM